MTVVGGFPLESSKRITEKSNEGIRMNKLGFGFCVCRRWAAKMLTGRSWRPWWMSSLPGGGTYFDTAYTYLTG